MFDVLAQGANYCNDSYSRNPSFSYFLHCVSQSTIEPKCGLRSLIYNLGETELADYYTWDIKRVIPVGTPVTRRPPDRSQRAELPHWAPALGKDAQALLRIRMLLIPLRCLPYPSQLMLQVFPALRPVPGL